MPLALRSIVLPVGISFYTFMAISYVVDTYRGDAREPDWMRYLLFVTWFPHLIAGPIIHHKETMPQFAASVSRTTVAVSVNRMDGSRLP